VHVVREKTVRDWIGRGMLQAYKTGRIWGIRSDHLEQAMEARRVSTPAGPRGGVSDSGR
jgi:excisionase family DNA binding protein